MRKVILCASLALVPFVGLAVEPPALHLVRGGTLLMTVPRLPGGGCPSRYGSVTMTEIGRPNTMWALQRVGVPVEHNQTDTCTSVVGLDQWSGTLRDGQRLRVSGKVGRVGPPSIDLVTSCNDQVCTLEAAPPCDTDTATECRINAGGIIGEDIVASRIKPAR